MRGQHPWVRGALPIPGLAELTAVEFGAIVTPFAASRPNLDGDFGLAVEPCLGHLADSAGRPRWGALRGLALGVFPAGHP